MSTFTYEYSTTTKLETFEWDNTWIDHANDRECARVLYIGDSISCGVRKLCTERSKGKFLFDGFGTSKALDHPVFFESVRLFASQQPRRDLILFNNGLHGWHLNDQKEYAAYYERMIQTIRSEYPETALYLVLTTAVADEATNLRVKARNEVALNLARQYALPTIDLYTVSEQFSALRTADGVHFTKEGYEKFADCILSALS